MILDVRTMYVVGAMTCVVLGCAQLMAFATGRFERWPAWWGLSNILVGLGMAGTASQGILPSLVSVVLADFVTLTGYFLLLNGIKVFTGRRTDWRVCTFVTAVTTVLIACFWNDPAAYPTRIAFLSVVFAGCDFAIAREGFRLAWCERLASAWILVGLFSSTTLLLAARAVMAFTGHFGGYELVSNEAGVHQWIDVIGVMVFDLRGMTLLLIAAERSRNLLLALAQLDPLTGAMNRGGLAQSVERLATSRHAVSSARISLLLIDIDHFKMINDTAGHSGGDAVLRLLVSTAKSQLRDGDLLARHGGDEFVAVLPNASPEEAIGAAERIRQAFDAAVLNMTDLPMRPTLSIGVADGDVVSERLDMILKTADEALYRSKRLGRNRTQWATSETFA